MAMLYLTQVSYLVLPNMCPYWFFPSFPGKQGTFRGCYVSNTATHGYMTGMISEYGVFDMDMSKEL